MPYVTGATHGESGGKTDEGALLSLRPGVRGMPVPSYRDGEAG